MSTNDIYKAGSISGRGTDISEVSSSSMSTFVLECTTSTWDSRVSLGTFSSSQSGHTARAVDV